MSRKTTTRTFPIVLKTIITDCVKSNPSFTLNDKQVRSRLRANEKVRAFHVPNTSHVANNASQYDAIRAAFDTKYAASIAKAPRKARAKKAPVADVADANA